VINIYAESLIGKDNNKAASYYAKYVELVNNNPNAMNNYAWVLLQLGRLDEAVAYANRALALSPKDLAFTDTLASILIAKTSYKEAISLIEDVKAPTTDLTLALTQAYILDKQTNKAKMIITSINNEKLSAAQKTKLSELQKLI
jgi:tetratricopeptide (TPR) repeat protein